MIIHLIFIRCLADTGFRQIKVNNRRRIINTFFAYYLKYFIFIVLICITLN